MQLREFARAEARETGRSQISDSKPVDLWGCTRRDAWREDCIA